MRKEGEKLKKRIGEGWDDKGGHSAGANEEWELRNKTDITHTIAHPWSLLIKLVKLAASGWVCSSVTLWVDAFEVQFIN